MPAATLPVLLSVLVVSAMSLAGSAVLALGPDRLKRVLPALVALAAGALLGDSFLHLLPEAAHHEGGFTPFVAWSALGGLLGFFAIEQAIHWHHHGDDLEPETDHVHAVAWMNLLGDMVHNLVDGMLIAGTWLVSPEAGLATTVAVAFHEIPQEFGDFGVLLHSGMAPRRALLLNFLSACAAFVGAGLVLATHGALHLDRALVPVAAGGFLYVACADLVPELKRRARGRQRLVLGGALALGVAVVAGLGFLPGHEAAHGAHGEETPAVHDHDHDGHDHR
jgi:zinc and cadmium transporter